LPAKTDIAWCSGPGFGISPWAIARAAAKTSGIVSVASLFMISSSKWPSF
jgi:hypothetical protein